MAIMLLSGSIVILTWTAKTFGRPEDNLDKQHANLTVKALLPDNAQAPDSHTKHRRE
ncbi:hypothetical protein [Psychrobacter sp. JCM 18900]|uniref:hypothetical protein n=1 Tax=Psychrobacter sp. JCM 18900 TaxID=1298608 RepID=UPI0004BB7A3D|nr:hypothetical protein [Psychrobacter sp. JCM 18900]